VVNISPFLPTHLSSLQFFEERVRQRDDNVRERERESKIFVVSSLKLDIEPT
jgi:hypothetical protein